MRCAPHNRTIGEFVRDEIAQPLLLESQLTLGKETMENAHSLFPLVEKSTTWILCQLGNFFHRKVSLISLIVYLMSVKFPVYWHHIQVFFKGKNAPSLSLALDEDAISNGPWGVSTVQLFNHDLIREAEIPSANGHASAYALAKVASVMAHRGDAHGVRLLNSGTYDKAVGNATVKYDRAISQTTKFTAGGWHIFDSAFAFGHNRHGSIGWFGIGGSALQWHDELKMGFGYAGTLQGAELGNKNSSIVQNEIVKCAKRIMKRD